MRKLLIIMSVCGSIFATSAELALADTEISSIYLGLGYGKVSVGDGEIQYEDTDAALSGSLTLGYHLNSSFAVEAQYLSTVKDAKGTYWLEDMDFALPFWSELASNTPGVTLSDAQNMYPAVNADINVEITGIFDAFALYGAYRSQGDLYIKAKLGIVNARTEVTAAPTSIALRLQDYTGALTPVNLQKGDEGFAGITQNATIIKKETTTDLSGGLGVGYKLSERLALELEYTRLTDNIDIGSLSFQYRF